MLEIREVQKRYAARYAVGVCSAIRILVDEEDFVKLFGAKNIEEAVSRCVRGGMLKAEEVAWKWLFTQLRYNLF